MRRPSGENRACDSAPAPVSNTVEVSASKSKRDEILAVVDENRSTIGSPDRVVEEGRLTGPVARHRDETAVVEKHSAIPGRWIELHQS